MWFILTRVEKLHAASTPKVLLSCPEPCGGGYHTETALPAVLSPRYNVPTGSDSSDAEHPLARVARRTRFQSTGRVRLKVAVPRVSSGTCACDTAPLAGPGTVVSRSAAGKGARAGQWHWLVLEGPELACGPESPSEPGRSRTRGMEKQVLSSPSGCLAASLTNELLTEAGK